MKARVRRLQRQLAMGQIRKVVPKATCDHQPDPLRLALQYDQSRAAAPFVVAKAPMKSPSNSPGRR
ncbi:lateral flagellar export/assembly protein (FlhB-like) [Escherichia coli]|uniref:Lateral flagellar export/assembly protein (FlhB-like) n=1 Tax=Escherichia coli TaxID=562 RepID=A0A377DG47_ECOLX|nr:lateral flagellar export/assembly protein (FlhB-like) [Escherichia coli]